MILAIRGEKCGARWVSWGFRNAQTSASSFETEYSSKAEKDRLTENGAGTLLARLFATIKTTCYQS